MTTTTETHRYGSEDFIRDCATLGYTRAQVEAFTLADAKRVNAELDIQFWVDHGELIRLEGGRVIEADRFDPAVHVAAK